MKVLKKIKKKMGIGRSLLMIMCLPREDLINYPSVTSIYNEDQGKFRIVGNTSAKFKICIQFQMVWLVDV